MFCENCGKSNENGAVFCEQCGARLTPPAPQQVPQQPQYQQPQYQQPVYQQPPYAQAAPVQAAPKVSVMDRVKQIHNKNKFIFPGIGAAIVLVVVVLIVVSILGKQVNVSNYLNVEVTGYEGYGQLKYDFDETAFVLRALGLKDYEGYGDADELDEEELTEIAQEYKNKTKTLEKLVNSIEITTELPEGRTSSTLKNNDVVKLTVKLNEDAAKDLGITPKKLTMEYTVTGLAEISVYNPLDNFSLVFDGYDGYGSYELICTKTEEKDLGSLIFTTTEGETYIQVQRKDEDYGSSLYVYVEMDSYYNLSNGDVATVYIETDENRYVSDGVMLGAVKKEFTVEGLKELEEYDPFSNIVAGFEGINGDGTPNFTFVEETVTVGELTFDFEDGDIYAGDEYVTYISSDYDPWRYLSNGDEFTVTLSANAETLAKYGVVLSATEKTYTVSGLATYAADLDSIRDGLTDVTAEAQSILVDWLYDSWNSAVHNSYWSSPSNQQVVAEPTLYKLILTTPKSSSSSSNNNLWMIFKATLNDSKLGEATELYFAVMVEDVAVTADGTVYLADDYFNKYHAEASYEDIYSEYIEAYNKNIFE